MRRHKKWHLDEMSNTNTSSLGGLAHSSVRPCFCQPPCFAFFLAATPASLSHASLCVWQMCAVECHYIRLALALKTRRKAPRGSNLVPLCEQFFCQCAESDCGKWTAVQKNQALEFCACTRDATGEICQGCNLPLFRCKYGLEVIQMGVKDPCKESCDYCIWLQEGGDVWRLPRECKACNDPAKLLSHHVLPLIQRFMDKASPGGAYLVTREWWVAGINPGR